MRWERTVAGGAVSGAGTVVPCDGGGSGAGAAGSGDDQ